MTVPASTTASSTRALRPCEGARRDPLGRVRQIPLPAEVRALTTLSHVDYEDAFLVEVGAAQGRTGEQWARVLFGRAPSLLRAKLWCTWCALGLRLGPPRSRRFVLGWEVRRRAPDFVLLGAGSRIGMPAELLLRRQRDELLFATLVQKDGLLARVAWAAIEPLHLPVLRYLLERGSRPQR